MEFPAILAVLDCDRELVTAEKQAQVERMEADLATTPAL